MVATMEWRETVPREIRENKRETEREIDVEKGRRVTGIKEEGECIRRCPHGMEEVRVSEEKKTGNI